MLVPLVTSVMCCFDLLPIIVMFEELNVLLLIGKQTTACQHIIGEIFDGGFGAFVIQHCIPETWQSHTR